MKAIREACKPEFPLDRPLRRRPQIAPRDQGGDPYIRKVLDYSTWLHGDGPPGDGLRGEQFHGDRLHGKANPSPDTHSGDPEKPGQPTRNPVVEEWDRAGRTPLADGNAAA